jgi:protein phosphatase
VIPDGRPLRVVGDVHGDARAFAYAAATDRFVVQLGDLADGGPEGAEAWRIMLGLLEAGRGLFVLGNHDRKLGRALAGEAVQAGAELRATLGQLDAGLRARVLDAVRAAPAWVRAGPRLFVHGGFHPAMLHQAPPPALGRTPPPLARALFGQTTGRIQPDGYPERVLDWVERIPAGLTVYLGHDRRSGGGLPLTLRNESGGAAVFLDTGAGKGGHLSWLDLDATRP